MDKNVFSLCLIGLSSDGSPGLQECPKKIFLTGNVLTIRWPLIAHIKKYMFEIFFPKIKISQKYHS
jgi:hypothetical protein